MNLFRTDIHIHAVLTYWNSDTDTVARDILLREYGNLDAIILEGLWVCGQLYSENECDIMGVYGNLAELCEDLFLPMFIDEWELEVNEATRATIGVMNMVKDMYPVLMAYCNHLYHIDYPLPITEDISWSVLPYEYETSQSEIWEVTLCPEY